MLRNEGVPSTEYTDKAKYMHNQRVSMLVNYLNDVLPLQVIDETNYTAPVDLELPIDITDVPALRKVLSKCGFRLEETEQKGEMFILSQK